MSDVTSSAFGSLPPRVCVIGHPVAHSRSPLIHGFWLARHAIAGTYERRDIAPADIDTFLGRLSAEGYRGANVTVPHKEAAFRAAARRTPRAELAGAVNTLWFEPANADGALVGDNTDGYGFFAHLLAEHPDIALRGARIAILGAGGAARGIVPPFLAAGVSDILIVNRTFENAQALAQVFDGLEGAHVRAVPWADRAEALRGARVLINTTSLGMQGQPPLTLDLAPLPEDGVVADIVYVPLETDLLRRARLAGLRTLDGLGMLLHQAVPGFERWFGVRPVVDMDLRRHVLTSLEQ